MTKLVNAESNQLSESIPDVFWSLISGVNSRCFPDARSFLAGVFVEKTFKKLILASVLFVLYREALVD